MLRGWIQQRFQLESNHSQNSISIVPAYSALMERFGLWIFNPDLATDFRCINQFCCSTKTSVCAQAFESRRKQLSVPDQAQLFSAAAASAPYSSARRPGPPSRPSPTVWAKWTQLGKMFKTWATLCSGQKKKIVSME